MWKDGLSSSEPSCLTGVYNAGPHSAALTVSREILQCCHVLLVVLLVCLLVCLLSDLEDFSINSQVDTYRHMHICFSQLTHREKNKLFCKSKQLLLVHTESDDGCHWLPSVSLKCVLHVRNMYSSTLLLWLVLFTDEELLSKSQRSVPSLTNTLQHFF